MNNSVIIIGTQALQQRGLQTVNAKEKQGEDLCCRKESQIFLILLWLDTVLRHSKADDCANDSPPQLLESDLCNDRSKLSVKHKPRVSADCTAYAPSVLMSQRHRPKLKNKAMTWLLFLFLSRSTTKGQRPDMYLDFCTVTCTYGPFCISYTNTSATVHLPF